MGPLDIEELRREVRSLRRIVDALQGRLMPVATITLPAIPEALPLRKVAPLIGFSVSRLRWYMCSAEHRRAFDLDALLFRNGRRWFSTPQRIAQWLDARARKDPRLPVGVTSIEDLMRVGQ